MTDTIRVRVDVSLTAWISMYSVVAQMSALSGRLGIPFCCDFNGIDLTVVEGDDPAMIEDHYLRAIKLRVGNDNNTHPTVHTERWIADCSGRD